MLEKLTELESKAVLGFVGGSDLIKQQEQLLGKGSKWLSYVSKCTLTFFQCSFGTV